MSPTTSTNQDPASPTQQAKFEDDLISPENLELLITANPWPDLPELETFTTERFESEQNVFRPPQSATFDPVLHPGSVSNLSTPFFSQVPSQYPSLTPITAYPPVPQFTVPQMPSVPTAVDSRPPPEPFKVLPPGCFPPFAIKISQDQRGCPPGHVIMERYHKDTKRERAKVEQTTKKTSDKQKKRRKY